MTYGGPMPGMSLRLSPMMALPGAQITPVPPQATNLLGYFRLPPGWMVQLPARRPLGASIFV